jgi:AbrB family looped-hinge helix DNA binding protein
MEVTVDKYGRIVIPKPVRERLGLDAGSALELSVEPAEGGGDVLRLQPTHDRPGLVWEDGVFVHIGATDAPLDPVASVQRARDDRSRHLGNTELS